MLKLMKYELIKMRTMLLIMLALLVALEAGYLIGDALDDARVMGISLGLLTMLVFAVYVYILIAGIVSYSREINSKTGYMTFMVPVGPVGIVASKLLFTILAAIVVTALFGGAIYYDYAREFGKLNLDDNAYQQISFAFTMITGSMGGNVSLLRVILTLAFEAGTVLIEIILMMCTAYLAITLSATLLQNKRGFLRLLVSFALFVALNYITGKVGGLVSSDNAPETTAELLRLLGVRAAVHFAFA
ncbi:MAG: hypothetical protein ABS888_09595, partial [Eubacteriales bacterium]